MTKTHLADKRTPVLLRWFLLAPKPNSVALIFLFLIKSFFVAGCTDETSTAIDQFETRALEVIAGIADLGVPLPEALTHFEEIGLLGVDPTQVGDFWPLDVLSFVMVAPEQFDQSEVSVQLESILKSIETKLQKKLTRLESIPESQQNLIAIQISDNWEKTILDIASISQKAGSGQPVAKKAIDILCIPIVATSRIKDESRPDYGRSFPVNAVLYVANDQERGKIANHNNCLSRGIMSILGFPGIAKSFPSARDLDVSRGSLSNHDLAAILIAYRLGRYGMTPKELKDVLVALQHVNVKYNQ